ncbi:penicillin-binding protein 1C [Luteolibacter flavescens]|uniref:peptidoglycan glycosyltransferase n=1 Tax=Luteolibacter flavescens TaxID=1859460 RepID=A0ABT3FKP9_9BACT|nr:penicillin-binding protein 1C [Luteolibacter flavescens]MCW1884154.1 penicillin-binding protein 1C [Luteolibacter flavescens]
MKARRLLRRKRVAIPAAMAAAGLFAWYVLPWCVPLPAGLTDAPASPVLLDRGGRPLHHLVLPDYTRSSPVTLEEIPADLIACTIAAEDKRFHDHGGIDLLATARSAKDAVVHGRAVSGASTITQQLIKLTSPPAKRDLRTKVREALLARHLEMKWSKEQILTAYLNRLPYGNHRTGPAEAVRFYFQKPLSDLSLAESALLAGLPQAPSRLNPVRHPQRALVRRGMVLDRLAKNYDASRISAARAEPVALRPLTTRDLAPWLPSFENGQPSPRSLTTIDAGIQGDVESIVGEELAKLSGSHIKHAAVVVLDNRTREILALVSSGNWRDPNGGQINGALTLRSPGSALKPFTWLLSFDKGGLHPAAIVADIPTRFRTKEGLDAPENYDRTFRGPVSVREALACSLNVPAMRALNDLGGPRPLNDLLSGMGVLSVGPDASPYGLGLTLGSAPVRLLDLTNAYATLAEEGRHLPWKLWMEKQHDPVSHPMSPASCYLIADILSDPIARAPAFGRGGPLELPFRCAAKTGTSSDFRDNWCVGFTRDFTVGVWAGNFDNSPMKGVSGVAGAGPIFHRAMLRLHRNHAPQWLERPEGLVEVSIDPLTGKRTNAPGPATLVPADRMPLFASAADRDASGHVLLDSSYSEWFSSSHNRKRNAYALDKGMPAESPLRILAPRDGMTYQLDPELPNGGTLHLATNLPGQADWSCDTLEVSAGGAEAMVKLKPGNHILIATDKRNGGKQNVTIKVEQR